MPDGRGDPAVRYTYVNVAHARGDFFCPGGPSFPMYAIVRSGGKQYRVEEGALVSVDSLAGKVGETVTLGDILVIADGDDVKAGKPALGGAKVTAEIVAHGKGPKIHVLRYKNKTRQRRGRGHRQSETTLRITKIEA